MHNFPRRGLINRVIHEVEDELSSLPMVLLTPILSAILATTLAVSLPASHVHDGTVEGPSVPLSVGLAVAGAVSGLVLVGIVLTVWFWRRYLCRGDPRFRPGANHPYGNVFPLGLTCTGRFDAQTLGTFEAWVKHPSGEIEQCGELQGDRLQTPTRFLFIINPAEPGQYSVRWYLTPPGERRREIGRTTVSDPTMTSGTGAGRLIPPGSRR